MKFSSFFLLLFLAFISIAQTDAGKESSYQRPSPYYITAQDSTLLVQLPHLEMNEVFQKVELPAIVDHSTSPYFRPVFNQIGASCGQASSVAYAFTYEMCRARDWDATDSAHQFPSHFVYNFMNYNGYYGVNYMHSFEILRKLGTPTLQDYGGIAIDNGNVWISGYNKYYQAMNHRIKDVRTIKVNSEEGLLTLKHWLAHHMEGSEHGGVANFNAPAPWALKNLPSDSPEAGKKVMDYFPGDYATHAMTIVGYHDSIRYDYNNDGQYTNHLDINGDGVIDMRDWEIGGLKVANSYGADWGDNGFFFMMYKLLAENVVDGGIWNHQVEVINVKETYKPQLTYRVKLKHDRREQIRVVAGVAGEANALRPEHQLFLPVFDFQGGPQFMQGGTSDTNHKTIEFGLDVTPLLSYFESGNTASFFLEVYENDPQHIGSGEIIEFEVIYYEDDNPNGTLFPETNIPLLHNALTRLHVNKQLLFDQVEIVTEQIPVFDAGYQMQAEGGSMPYEWRMQQQYHQLILSHDFPQVEAEQLILEAPNYKFAKKTLDFEFPFFGHMYQDIYVHKDGFLLFEPEIYPWPYYQDTYLLFQTMKNIAVFLVNPVEYHPGTKQQEGVWYEGNETYAAFRWKQPIMFYDHNVGYGEFAVKLYPDGLIEYFYNDILIEEPILWYAGVSEGSQQQHHLLKGSNSTRLPNKQSFGLIPESLPDWINMDSDGFFTAIPIESQEIINFDVQVRDQNGIRDVQGFQFSNDLRFSYHLVSQDGFQMHNGSTVAVNLQVHNVSPESFNAITIAMSSTDPHVTVESGQYILDQLPPLGTINIDEAFTFVVDQACPDEHSLLFDLSFSSGSVTRNGRLSGIVHAAELLIQSNIVLDGDNNRLDPGEETELQIQLANAGSMAAMNVQARLTSDDPYIVLDETVSLDFGNILPGASSEALFTIAALGSCPTVHIANFDLLIEDQNGNIWTVSFELKIGQHGLFIYQRTTSDLSKDAITATLDMLDVPYTLGNSFPEEPDMYRAFMILMGGVHTSSVLMPEVISQLIEYLNTGGNIYMEGTSIWHFSKPEGLYEKFYVDGAMISPPLMLEKLIGLPGTFAEGTDFNFVDQYYNHVFIEVAPQQGTQALIFPDTDPGVTLMASHDAGTYRTIASSVEFLAFSHEDDVSDRLALMTGILNFLDLGYLITSIPDDVHPDVGNQLEVYPNPFTEELVIERSGFSSKLSTIVIESAAGRLVNQFELQAQENSNKLIWKGNDQNGLQIPAGIYFIRLLDGSNSEVRKVIKLR